MFWSNNELPSVSTLFSTYASVAASLMFFRSMINEFIPQPIRAYLFSIFHYFYKSHSSNLTLIFEESNGMGRNEIFEAAERYLCTKISPTTEKLKISKRPKEKSLTIQLDDGEKVTDFFQNMELNWRFVGLDRKDEDGTRSFELCFPKKQRDLVLGSYIPFVLDKAKEIKDSLRMLKMHTLSNNLKGGGGAWWDSIVLEHPSTFDTLAMPPELKRSVIEDLNRFKKRKEFYKKVGRAWKRGYLLYGPPGTGKSSLVAAIANYLKFDVYDLQLANIMRDSDLRKLLLATANRSILVIEDIDCSVSLPDRGTEDSGNSKHYSETHTQLTLSGLLNFIDGLWSSCGDERIIIFTTNHKERLDPALLRPGRMDMHIHMSYCDFHGFKLLASNYLGISGDHRLYGEIEKLLETTEVTPAQVAEEFMWEDVDDALEGLLKLLKEKKMEAEKKKQDKE